MFYLYACCQQCILHWWLSLLKPLNSPVCSQRETHDMRQNPATVNVWLCISAQGEFFMGMLHETHAIKATFCKAGQWMFQQDKVKPYSACFTLLWLHRVRVHVWLQSRSLLFCCMKWLKSIIQKIFDITQWYTFVRRDILTSEKVNDFCWFKPFSFTVILQDL